MNPHAEALDPKSSVYASFTTRANAWFAITNKIYIKDKVLSIGLVKKNQRFLFFFKLLKNLDFAIDKRFRIKYIVKVDYMVPIVQR